MARPLLAAALAALALAACSDGDGGSPTRPIMPSSPDPRPTPSPTPAATGDIGIRSIAPASGATLAARECADGPLTYVCTDQMRIEASVLVDRDVANARITAVFVDDTRMCGFALSPEGPVGAGRPASFVASRVLLSAQSDVPPGAPPATFQLCPLPATTSRVLVSLDEVMDGRVVATLLHREVSATYTFAAR